MVVDAREDYQNVNLVINNTPKELENDNVKVNDARSDAKKPYYDQYYAA